MSRVIYRRTRRPVRPAYRLTRRGEVVRDVAQGLVSMACFIMLVVTGAALFFRWFGII